MTKTKAETPSSAQQNGIETGSTNPGDGALATGAGIGALRVTPATGALGGWIGLNFIVAFIGESATRIRTVSLCGPGESRGAGPNDEGSGSVGLAAGGSAGLDPAGISGSV